MHISFPCLSSFCGKMSVWPFVSLKFQEKSLIMVEYKLKKQTILFWKNIIF